MTGDLPRPDDEVLAALLDFYLAAGVDLALEDMPQDRFAVSVPVAEKAAASLVRNEQDGRLGQAGTASRPEPGRAAQMPQSGARPATASPARGAATAGGDDAVMAARAAAQAAATLDELRSALAGFDGCHLKFTAKNLVFADGNPNASVMLIGEAPGRDEDIRGLPFVGRSGQLLDRMLAAIGLDRRAVYIANVVPWRPPGNRTPSPVETEICKPFIERQIALVDPEILVFLGAASAKQLLHTTEGILKLRGKWLTYRTSAGRSIRAMATLHPAYLLRHPLQKRLAWRDFLAIRSALKDCPPAG